MTGLNSSISGNNQTIFGSQFFQNYFSVFVNNYTTQPVTQTTQLFVAQNALNTTLLSSAARTTGTDVFPSPVTPTTYSKGLVIGISCAGGALLLALIVVSCVCYQKQKKQRTDADELVYRANNSESDSINAALIWVCYI